MDLDQLMAYAESNPSGGKGGPKGAGPAGGRGGIQDQRGEAQIGGITGKKGKIAPLPAESTDSPFYKPAYQQRPAPQQQRTAPPPQQQRTAPPPQRAPQPQRAPPPKAAPPPAQDENVLFTCKKAIAKRLIDADRELTGFIGAEDFLALLRSIAQVPVAELNRLVTHYDPLNVGSLNYFTLLSDISNQERSAGLLNDRRQTQTYAPSNDPAPQWEEDYDDGPQQPATADYRCPQLVSFLAQNVTKVFDSAPSAFHKWRGASKFLRASDFANGANRDLGLDMTVQEAQMMIDKVGGQLSVSYFVKLLGQGYNSFF